MMKKDEITNPNSCLNKAAPDEMIFVLRARDECAADTIRYWVALRLIKDKNMPSDIKIREALDIANAMEKQYKKAI